MSLSGLRDRLREQRWHRVLALSALTGAVTGLAIVGFEALTSRVLLDWVFEWPRAAQVAAPAIGLVLAWAALHWLGRDASPSTSDEYLRAYHDPKHPFETRAFPGRVLASIATLRWGAGCGTR
jgi:CIC family chloride channel protein